MARGKQYITNAVKAKIDRTAYAIVLMERGEYEFADGKPKYSKTPEGIRVHRVVHHEAQHYGWQSPSSRATFTDLFSPEGKYHELLQERLTHHRLRLSEGYGTELAKLTEDGNALTHLSKKLYDSLMDDLSDPDRSQSISFRDRAFLYKEVTKMEAAVKGDASTAGPQPVITAHNVIGTLNLPESVRASVMDRLDAIEIEGEAVDCTEE